MKSREQMITKQDLDMGNENYLKKELYEQVRNDPAIFEFFQSGSLDGIWYWDIEHPEHEWMSPQFWQTLGYDFREKKHLASEWQNLIDKEDLQTALDNFYKHCEDPSHPYDQIVRYRHKDGSTVWVRCRGMAVRDENGKPVRMLGAHTNLTELKRAENELVQARQLESIGLLAGGIAHDFNNLLAGILGNIQLARLEYSPSDKALAFLDNAESGLARARDLAGRLLTFSRGGDPVLERVEVKELLHSALGFSVGDSAITLNENYREEDLSLSADRGQFFQVVDNIVSNALQAMPEKDGCLEVDVSMVNFPSPDVDTGLEGEYVRIHFRDNGSGISKENIDKLFNPYFTTRTMGNGLGLATVFSIMQKHNGGISASSVPGEGAVFSVYFPVSREEADEQTPEVSECSGQVESAKSAAPRILLMDDDEMIRNIIEKLLERFGVDLDCASEGEEALRMYREAFDRGTPYSAVIMDLTIPSGMGGRETVQKLKEIDPQVRAIVSSGYTADPVMMRPEEFGFCGCLAKPFDLSEINRVLKDSCGLDI